MMHDFSVWIKDRWESVILSDIDSEKILSDGSIVKIKMLSVLEYVPKEILVPVEEKPRCSTSCSAL